MRSTVERRDSIIQIIQKNGKVRVDALSEKFDVSSVTIRNDLDFLEKKGIVHRTHGGALLRKSVYEDPSLEEKQQLYRKEKQRIGEKAVELIKDGDSILLDSGTTAMEIAQRLNGKKNLTVMTNAINLALKLGNLESMSVMLTGGLLRKESFSLVGPEAEATISNYYFDKLFLGVDGLDINFGLTTPNPMEAQLNRIMVERAQQVIAITDSSKFGRHSFSYICDVDVISTLITDTNISVEFERELLRRNIDVIKV
ncbi:MAG: DeoR family transcriptional regulator [Bacteroidetes bacterium]|jgi:DeoR family transcriptional regulator of aga operon|uniref:DeoR/GlpR family DNA-binding transcription regulator n=1 Tax=Rhodohalobacter sulfatireducens TaxID=2911366 RepID=A0ABS9K9F9_9BACT|nr:transcriptional repressor AgaR [Rhodohalobacter sulfatireducens]MCG2587452.1 DeoR/GlpR family DNA-binding transcription regulator [Rhodohalobacter sulfatireducens]MDR9365868.1 transcriptional repressor AgaR [Balneolaceae bacterium]MDR9409898.1 transcriptional repressor AgaR [Balneolaceae bacterium]NBC66465.1 DeoR family transcriptional regulator [Bacteroidota bacterium]